MPKAKAPVAFASGVEGSLTGSRERTARSAEDCREENSPEKLLDDLRRTMIADPAFARSAALRLATLLSGPSTADARTARGGLASWQLRKIDRYISENVATSLTIKVLADQLNMSASHFGRSFKMSLGFTPHLHITRFRLDLAHSLLLTTSDPICDIALTCGLADQAHLTKLFRRRFGETPAAWRRRHFNEDGPGTALGRNVNARVNSGIPDQPKPFAPIDRRNGRDQKSLFGVNATW